MLRECFWPGAGPGAVCREGFGHAASWEAWGCTVQAVVSARQVPWDRRELQGSRGASLGPQSAVRLGNTQVTARPGPSLKGAISEDPGGLAPFLIYMEDVHRFVHF